MPDLEQWPSLPFAEWRDTCATLHLWTQIVGKIRLARAPYINHWWQVPLYVSCRGLTTSPIPYDGGRSFSIDFDFADHRLSIETSDGAMSGLPLRPMAVADFYAAVMRQLRGLDLDIPIWTTPVEIPDPIPFEEDRTHAAYDADFANRFWRVLAQAERVMTAFRGRFLGKASPVHFFWGSFDLAVTRFSGRPAPSTSGRAQRRRPGHPRGLFARGFELRLLAGGRRVRGAGLLCLRLSAAGGLRRGADRPRRRLLQPGNGRVPAALRGGPAGARPGPALARFLAEHL